MKIRVVDPAAYTLPYDHALCSALGAADGGQHGVDLFTSRSRYGSMPAAKAYAIHEHFYRLPGPLPVRVAQHPLDMLRLRRGHQPDINHFQWLPMQAVDRLLLPAGVNVLTAHDVIPREPRVGQLGALKALYNSVDAVVVHSEHGRGRLIDELGVAADRVHMIHHGAFDYLTKLPDEQPLPPELAEVTRPVVLCFGLMRPYKGIDLAIEAMRTVADAELWVVGMPRMPIEPLRKAASELGDRVKFVSRFVPDVEIPAYFRRADVVVLPYREIDQSGVLYTALAFGKPMVVTSVGGFTEFADQTGAAKLVAPGNPAELSDAISAVLADSEARDRLARAATAAAIGSFAWPRIADQTLALYRSLI